MTMWMIYVIYRSNLNRSKWHKSSLFLFLDSFLSLYSTVASLRADISFRCGCCVSFDFENALKNDSVRDASNQPNQINKNECCWPAKYINWHDVFVFVYLLIGFQGILKQFSCKRALNTKCENDICVKNVLWILYLSILVEFYPHKSHQIQTKFARKEK